MRPTQPLPAALIVPGHCSVQPKRFNCTANNRTQHAFTRRKKGKRELISYRQRRRNHPVGCNGKQAVARILPSSAPVGVAITTRAWVIIPCRSMFYIYVMTTMRIQHSSHLVLTYQRELPVAADPEAEAVTARQHVQRTPPHHAPQLVLKSQHIHTKQRCSDKGRRPLSSTQTAARGSRRPEQQ